MTQTQIYSGLAVEGISTPLWGSGDDMGRRISPFLCVLRTELSRRKTVLSHFLHTFPGPD